MKHAENAVAYSEKHLLSIIKTTTHSSIAVLILCSFTAPPLPLSSHQVQDAYATLALSCYNFAVELEFLNCSSDALRLYARALGIVQE